MQYHSQPLDPEQHSLDGFSCGTPSLDDWLQRTALTAEARGTARTWVWVDEGSGRVVAYYALAARKVAPQAVPSRLRTGSAEIPAVLLGRLALDQTLRGQSLGPVLIADALARVVDATRMVGARLVVVDALSEAVAVKVYEPLGFRRVPGSLLLVQRVVDIAAALSD